MSSCASSAPSAPAESTHGVPPAGALPAAGSHAAAPGRAHHVAYSAAEPHAGANVRADARAHRRTLRRPLRLALVHLRLQLARALLRRRRLRLRRSEHLVCARTGRLSLSRQLLARRCELGCQLLEIGRAHV